MYVSSFYQFVPLQKLQQLQTVINENLIDRGVTGTVVLATEGINASLAHRERECLHEVIEQIQDAHSQFSFRPVHSEGNSAVIFEWLRVVVRDKIVAAESEYHFSLPPVHRVSAAEWNQLLHTDDVLVLDVRNHYEYRLGRFNVARTLDLQTFADLPSLLSSELRVDKDKTIAMYCTGGIRCEKAAQTLTEQGFQSIMQLDRGILGYFEADPVPNHWEGECFVFDKRVSVTTDLTEGTANLCLACRSPLLPKDRAAESFHYGISCPYCVDELTTERKRSLEERLFQINLSTQRATGAL